MLAVYYIFSVLFIVCGIFLNMGEYADYLDLMVGSILIFAGILLLMTCLVTNIIVVLSN